MKQKDVILIIVIVFISGIFSFVVSGKLFSSSSDRQQTSVVVDSINPGFSLPSTTYFNSNSIDPTQLIQIGNSNNPNPFSGSQ